jgi:hypothetical protein
MQLYVQVSVSTHLSVLSCPDFLDAKRVRIGVRR